MAKKKAGKVISPSQMAAQWRSLPHQFDLNLFNFAATIGHDATEIFKQSFDMRRLNTSGSVTWRKRRDKRPHPILNETLTLKNSIKYRSLKDSGKRLIRIYTDPTAFGTAARHRGFCYAAVHNDPSGRHYYGKTGVKSIQRQFIGHSTALTDRFKKLAVSIFNGFPQ